MKNVHWWSQTHLNFDQSYLFVFGLNTTPKKEITLMKSCSSLFDHLQ